MAAKNKKTEYVCAPSSSDPMDIELAGAFRIKADIRIMKEQKEMAMGEIAAKLGDISGVAEYTEKDLGNGLFITIAPPYTASQFDDKVYAKWLEDNGLMEEAYRKGICRETEEVKETLRFSSDYLEKSNATLASFADCITCAGLEDAARICTGLKADIKAAECRYEDAVGRIIQAGLEKFGNDLFGLKFTYDDGDIKCSMSFSHSPKKSFDLDRTAEMLPSGMPEDERNAVLKGRTVTVSSHVITAVTEETLKKMRAYRKGKEPAEEAAICM